MSLEVIEGQHIEWENLQFKFSFEKNLSEAHGEELKKVVYAWNLLGSVKAYEGLLHTMSEVWVEKNQLGFWVDMGSADESCLEILFQAFEGFAEIEMIRILNVTLGDDIEDDEDGEEDDEVEE